MFLKERISKKKRFFIALIFVLIFAGSAGFFYFWQHREIKGSPDDYVIIETDEGIIVKNERAGLTMKAPDGWTVRKIEVLEGSVVFYSPDAQGLNPEKIRPPLQKGCMIEAAMAYRKTNFEELKEEIKEIHDGLVIRKDDIEVIELEGKNFLKNSFDCLELGNSINIYYILKNKFYSFSVSGSDENLENCSDYLSNFIEKTSIIE